MRTVYRFGVPVIDQPTTVEDCLVGPVVHVASRHSPDTVEFWIDGIKGDTAPRVFRVFGTGHAIPEGAVYLGTALAAMGLVWHLYEL